MFPPGLFCWVDFHSTDASRAAEFYTGVLGWTTREEAGSSDSRLFLSQGKVAGALRCLSPEQQKLGVPPHWMPYLAVDDVDAVSARVRKAGGRVVLAPFEALTAGRMALCCDPAGGHFCLWQGRAQPGVEVVGEVGGMCWHELISTHPRSAARFYPRVFGWTAREFRLGPVPYTIFFQGEQRVAGMMARPAGVTTPSFWLVYFQVPDYAVAVEKCQSLNGALATQPVEVEGVGRFCTLLDAEGAAFAVLSR